jgi:hypothetical protein
MSVTGKVETFAPHTTDIFQVRDLTVFGIFKRERKYSLPFEGVATAITFICNLDIKMTKAPTLRRCLN